MAPALGPCTYPQFQALLDLREEFKEKTEIYKLAEQKWRNIAFRLSVMMGILPVAAGITQLMPEMVRPYSTLFIAVTNVIVVVANVKLDIGERTADAGSASKGYQKMATQINLFFCHLRCGDQLDTMELLVKVRAVSESIEANLSYPEVRKAVKHMPELPIHMPQGIHAPELPIHMPHGIHLPPALHLPGHTEATAEQAPPSSQPSIAQMAAGLRRFSAVPLNGASDPQAVFGRESTAMLGGDPTASTAVASSGGFDMSSQDQPSSGVDDALLGGPTNPRSSTAPRKSKSARSKARALQPLTQDLLPPPDGGQTEECF